MGNQFRIAAWLIQPQLNSVSKNGTTIHLEPKVMGVLACLASHAGEPVSKQELLHIVWPDTFVTDDVLKRAISELRSVFEDDVREPSVIQTIPKRGYRLLIPVEPAGPAQSSSARQQDLTDISRNQPNRIVLAAGSAALLLIASITTYLYLRQTSAAKGAAPQIRSVAVLPLQNLSGDPNQEYFSDGMTDALITDLAQIDSLKVISRTSSMQYKQTRKSLPEIGRELGVDGIVEGSIQRSGDQVRITAQLIHSPSDRHLWANTFEGNFRDLFTLERTITQDIARQIQARLSAEDRRGAPHPHQTNARALEAYLQGTYHLNKYGRGSGVEERMKAAGYFQQAIDADPNFVLSYIGLSNAHDDLPVSSPQDRQARRAAAEKALRMDPNSSEAWVILASFEGGDFDWTRADRAEQGYRRAIALNPNNAGAHDQFCEFLAEMRRLDDALAECEISQELDPNNDHLGGIFYERGDYDHAIAAMTRTLESHPDDGGLHYGLFNCYAKKQNYKEAVEELEKTFVLYGESDVAQRIHHALSTAGYRAAILQSAKEVEQLQAERQLYFPVNLADFYAIVGDTERAIYWLQQAYLHRDLIATGEGATFMGVDPMLIPLRSDPRFKDLLRRLGAWPTS